MLESPCDIPDPIKSILTEFEEVYPNLDSSLLDKQNDMWFLENMGDP